MSNGHCEVAALRPETAVRNHTGVAATSAEPHGKSMPEDDVQAGHWLAVAWIFTVRCPRVRMRADLRQ